MGDAAPDQPKSEPGTASEGTPDWLVGAEEGVSAEFSRTEGGAPRTAPVIKLSRPGGADAGIESPGLRAQELTGPAPSAGTMPHGGETVLDLQGGDTSAAPYTPAAGSESLRLPSGGPRAVAAAAKPEKKAWVAAASSVPSLRVERRRVERRPDGVPRMDEVDADAPAENEFPDDNSTPTLSLVPGGKPAPGAPPPPAPHAVRRAPVLKEAVWLVVLDDIRTNRRTQILIGTALLLFVAWTFWPRDINTVSISKLRTHPEQYDGSMVSVRGRVGEVFPVGAGYAYYLHQGRDTLVVFTQSARPQSRQTVTATGSITTGFLDGRPRQALFEGR